LHREGRQRDFAQWLWEKYLSQPKPSQHAARASGSLVPVSESFVNFQPINIITRRDYAPDRLETDYLTTIGKLKPSVITLLDERRCSRQDAPHSDGLQKCQSVMQTPAQIRQGLRLIDKKLRAKTLLDNARVALCDASRSRFEQKEPLC
jgi:hypothetical protein